MGAIRPSNARTRKRRILLPLAVFAFIYIVHILRRDFNQFYDNDQLIETAAESIDSVDEATPERDYTKLPSSLPPRLLPKVALLFLTLGPMPLESIWTTFFGHGSNWSNYFSIYVHPSPDYTFPSNSFFFPHTILYPTRTAWGSHSILEAERLLLRNALEDPSNTRFVLLSESTIPLYSAAATYAQIITEKRSRVNACANMSDVGDIERRMLYRLQPAMMAAGIAPEKWRKSSQWFVLTRSHAQLVVEDTELDAAFKQDCYIEQERGIKGVPGRFCISDEHYIPTLLAVHEKEEECSCLGEGTKTTWPGNIFHPKEFGKKDATSKVFKGVFREESQCVEGGELEQNVEEMLREVVATAEERRSRVSAKEIAAAMHRRRVPRMKPECSLFARKIAADAGREWLKIYQSHILSSPS